MGETRARECNNPGSHGVVTGWYQGGGKLAVAENETENRRVKHKVTVE